jgi:hypothetical protein
VDRREFQFGADAWFRIGYSSVMRDSEGFEIRHNGMPRSFRDKKETAFEAARFGKARNPGDVIEIIDRSTGTKMLMLLDGRIG